MRQNKTFALRYNVGDNVYFRCDNCNKKLKGHETHCPSCNLVIVNSKEKISQFMKSEKKEKPKKTDGEKELLTKIQGKKLEISFENEASASYSSVASLEEQSTEEGGNFAKIVLSIVTAASVIGVIIFIGILINNFYPVQGSGVIDEDSYEVYYPTYEDYTVYAYYAYEEQYYENYENYENYEAYEYENQGPPTSIYELEAYAYYFMSQFGDSFSIFFENFETGFVFYYNPYEEYPAVSVAFLPFAYYIWYKSSAGHNSILEYVEFQEIDRWSGTGIIQNIYETGTFLTQRRLLETLIGNSDNIASLMLRRHHGVSTYTAFINEIGANENLINNITDSYIDAFNAGLFMRRIYEFLEAGFYYSNYFRRDILDHNHSFVNFSYPTASKTAWGVNVMHELAIVYAPSPFSLSILSSRHGNANDRVIFQEIVDFFERFNENF